MDLLPLIRNTLFPLDCPLCASPLLGAEEIRTGLCAPCAAALPLDGAPRCVRCGRPLISESRVCAECRNYPEPPFDGAFALFRYGRLAKELLRAYKFGQDRALAAFWADRLFEAAQGRAPEWGAWDAWVPVPPKRGKLRAKGWDQVDLLARRLERRHNCTVERCLKRLTSRSQKELCREDRAANLRGRILCAARPPERVLLFDDVITTGATLSACAQALKDAGSRVVYVMALCHD